MPRLSKAKTKAKLREPNGRLSRRKTEVRERTDMTEREAKAVCIAARMRHTGLAEIYVDGKPETGKPNVGTPQGLLRLQGYINDDQWRAAEWYLHCRNEMLQAIKAPGAQWQQYLQASGLSDAERQKAYNAWSLAARIRWRDIVRCIHEASIESRSPIMAAFDHVLERGTEGLSHMYGDLRFGLNAINREFLMRRAA